MFHSFETSYSTFNSFPCSLSSMFCLSDTCWVFTLEFIVFYTHHSFNVTFFLGSPLFYSVVIKSSRTSSFSLSSHRHSYRSHLFNYRFIVSCENKWTSMTHFNKVTRTKVFETRRYYKLVLPVFPSQKPPLPEEGGF